MLNFRGVKFLLPKFNGPFRNWPFNFVTFCGLFSWTVRVGLLEWAVKLNPRHTWSLRVKRKPWEQHIYEQRSSTFCHQIHLEMKNSTQRKYTIPNSNTPTTCIFPQKSHPKISLHFHQKTNESTLPWQKKHGPFAVLLLGMSEVAFVTWEQTIHAWNPKHPLRKMGGNQLDDEPNLHMKNELHEHRTIHP